MLEQGLFIRPCPGCLNEIEIKLNDAKDDITITSKVIAPASKVAEVAVPHEHQERKCSYCFRLSIPGGVLCKHHSFCRSCEKTFPDGKPFKIEEFPTCEICAK